MSGDLLTLVMMVKDEAASIVQSIESCLPHVDRVVVLDTGSTDGTQSLAREAAGDVPFELHEEPFADYGTTRNRALELAGHATVFALMLSGDETLVNGEALRGHCGRHRFCEGDEHGAYLMSVRVEDRCVVPSVRLSRTTGPWRYRGVVHEAMFCPGVSRDPYTVEGCHVLHVRSDSKEQLRAKWSRWLELLQAENAREPHNSRTVYCLAQTYHELDRFSEAIRVYEESLVLGRWPEQLYESMYRTGDCYEQLGKWDEAQRCYLAAHSRMPNRAEPLVALARHYREREDWALTYLYAARAAELPVPESPMSVDMHIYDFERHALVAASAFQVGEPERGRSAVIAALRSNPKDGGLLKMLAGCRDPQP
jgi:glycosyltransferase involved in cell wall biosynthesis